MKDIQKYLIENIPEFQSDSPHLKSYLNAAGEFLNGIKERIEGIDHIKDYELIGFSGLNSNLYERGNNLPRALPNSFRRNWLRDIADHKAKFGTESALRHALSSIGVVGEIKSTWVLSPDLMSEGKYRDPSDGKVYDFPIDVKVGGEFRTKFLYGETVVTDDGTFVEGYDYFDLDKEHPTIYHIHGEQYENPINKSVKFVAAKTPYIIVNFFREDFNINTGSYVDPVTGEVYEYTAVEEAILMDEIIRFFSLGENRPTTLKIIMVIIDRFEDEFFVVDEELMEDNFICLSKYYPVHSEDNPVHTDLVPVGVGGHWEGEDINLDTDFDVNEEFGDDIQEDSFVIEGDVFEDNFISLTKSYEVMSEEDSVNSEGNVVIVGGQQIKSPTSVEESMGSEVLFESEYKDLFGRPCSESSDIDDSVIKKHAHANKNSLDSLGEVGGLLSVDGKVVQLHWMIKEW